MRRGLVIGIVVGLALAGIGACNKSDTLGTGAGGNDGGGNASGGSHAGSGTGGSASGGATGAGGGPTFDAAVVEAGIDCTGDPSACDSASFCSAVQFDGVVLAHNCLPKGSCQSCDCLTAVVAAYVHAHYPSTVNPQICKCTGAPDDGGTTVSCTEP